MSFLHCSKGHNRTKCTCLLGAGGFKEDFKACLYVSSMEVGVCAEAYQGREPLRHINSAFMTFEVLDSNWKPRTLPRIRPEPVVSLMLNPASLKTHSTNKWGKMSILGQGFH